MGSGTEGPVWQGNGVNRSLRQLVTLDNMEAVDEHHALLAFFFFSFSQLG